MFEEAERPAAQEKLLELIHASGDVNACGVIGLRHIFHVLTDMGQSELALRMILHPGRTCYGYWLENGFSTLQEYFFAMGHPRTGSFNHHFHGDVSNWMLRTVAGLSPNPHADDVSYVAFTPHPVLDGQHSFARAHFDGCKGRVSIEWERTDDRLTLWLELAAGMHATLYASDGWRLDDASESLYIEKSDRNRRICCHMVRVSGSDHQS